MNAIFTILNIACGKPIPDEDSGRSRRLQLVLAAFLFSVVFAVLWGLAAGSLSAGQALANVYKVPMVILLSSVFAVPAGLLAWKFSGSTVRGTDLALSFASSVFGGTLVLAVLSPLVALFYHSSDWAGPWLAMGTGLIALATGLFMFVRGAYRRTKSGAARTPVLIPVGVMIAMQLATLFQLIAIASPILPERTVFSDGIDNIGQVQQ